MEQRPVVGITMGDPAGNGPELLIKALQHKEVYDICRPIVIGDASVVALAAKLLCPYHAVRRVGDIEDAHFSYGEVDVYHLELVDPSAFEYGLVSAMCGRAAYLSIKKAIELALDGTLDAICTNAINKTSLHLALEPENLHFEGHTEIFAHYTNTKKYAMMLAFENLRVVHVSTHCSLREACDRVKKERVLETIRLANQACKSLGLPQPRIAVAGLNPHAGENGLFGREEIEEISPAVVLAQSEGILAEGAFPPDSLFANALGGGYDIVVAMYHDQGHIPIKTTGFSYDGSIGQWRAAEGVNITLGLPIIRTSVDHGTGFDQAWKGISSDKSLFNAIEYAAKMGKTRSNAKRG